MSTARGGLDSAKVGKCLITCGGEGNPNEPVDMVFESTAVYDAEEDEWHELDSMSIPRHRTGAVAVECKMYVPRSGVKISAAPTDARSMFDT